MAQRVRDVMTANPWAVGPDTPAHQVATIMRDESVKAVVVTDDGRLRGLVTDRDLTVRILADGGDVSARTVVEACGAELASVAPEDDVDRALTLMYAKELRHLPVIDNGRTVGIIALRDLGVEAGPGFGLDAPGVADSMA
ncbi:CBS domain-containing protein [Streptomyces sp. NPDC008313]|uniref:CBS domain-containing protein n=1 Tax=Streptomyces sp. NPDC008313 TaxID=3364826 RepID=UPI0036ED899D